MNTKDHASSRPLAARAIALVVSLGMLFSGCTSTRFHTPSSGTSLTAEVRVGDRVNCRMNDGTQKTLTVTAVEPATLVGENIRVPVAEVSSIEITRFDGKKTITESFKLVGGVVLVTGMIGLCLVSHGAPILAFR